MTQTVVAVPLIAQLKLQRHFGGGEAFTRFLCDAIASAGRRNLLFVHPEARFWRTLDLPATELEPLGDAAAVPARLPAGVPLVVHGDLPQAVLDRLATAHPVVRIVHMPATYVDAQQFHAYSRVLGVSQHVIDTLRRAGVSPHAAPFYGIADAARLAAGAAGPIRRRSEYEWDRRKLRDRLLGLIEPALATLREGACYSRRPGLTIGIVSRLTPIKQFPEMFGILAPVMARSPQVHLEIFGAGGYASVRDLRRALRPLGGRVRFWGAQEDVGRVYRQIDYLLAGLPEREALGLNVLEAQACGTPVLAVDAPPFTETVIDGQSGYLFADPRRDAGRGFGELLQALCHGLPRPDPSKAAEQLAPFSEASFRARVARDLLAFVDEHAAVAR